MSDWVETTLGDVLNFQRGIDITRATQREGSIPVVSSGGISSYHDTASARGPGVVIGRKGTLGKVFYLPTDYWPHDTTLWVQNFKGNHPRFVYYFMTQFDTAWLDAGSANPTLNRNHLHPLKVLWPPLTDQSAIAEVLGALDDKIAANTKLAATAEALAVAQLNRLQPSVSLNEIVKYQKNSTNPEMLENPSVAQYSLPAFDTGQLPEESSPLDIKSSKFLIERPAVLVSKLNPRFPRIWDVSEVPSIPALASTEFLVLEPTCSSTTVLWAILSQPRFSAALESKVAGTSGSHQRVKPADLLATLVPDPREISTDIQDCVTSVGLRASQTRLENAQLSATRDALLPQLMSGKLRVKDAESLVSAAV